MTSREISKMFPALDSRRIGDLGIDSLAELAAMAKADPKAFAGYFELDDAPSLIAHLEKLLKGEENSPLYGPSIILPPSGVPFEAWPPASRPALSPTDLAKRDRLVARIRVLQAQPSNFVKKNRALADATAALRRLLHSES